MYLLFLYYTDFFSPAEGLPFISVPLLCFSFLFFIIFTPTSHCSVRVKCASETISCNVSIGRNFHFIIYCVFVIGKLLKL